MFLHLTGSFVFHLRAPPHLFGEDSMKVKPTKVAKRFLSLEFENKRDRDKFYEYIIKLMKKEVS